MIPKSILALGLAVIAASPAAAETESVAACRESALPFEVNAGNRLTGAVLQQALGGKRLVYVRPSLRVKGVWSQNTRELRSDGSMVYTCEYSRSAAGPWQPCKSIGSMQRRVPGARDVGVWSIKSDAVCMTGASFGAEACFAIHRQRAALAAKRVSGSAASCFGGAIALQ